MLRLARRAQTAANAELADGRIIEVVVNNSDGQGNSYGSHLDFLITRDAWDDLFRHRLHTLPFLASYQASASVHRPGSGPERPAGSGYQISQRADFFETLSSIETTQRRPIVNSRNEALCGGFRRAVKGNIPALDMARLHVIFYDNTLCPVACLLKVGVLQIVLAMIEVGRVNPELILDNPLAAVRDWSHDPSLRAGRN
jgi:proteasome accessory factor A